MAASRASSVRFARCPSGSRRRRRPRARRDGTGWRSRSASTRTLPQRRARRAACRVAPLNPSRSSSGRAGPPGVPARRAAGMPCRARRAAGRAPLPGSPRDRRPWRPRARIQRRRRSAAPSETDPADCARASPGRHRAGSRTSPGRWRRRGSSRASTHRPQTEWTSQPRRSESWLASCRAPRAPWHRTGRWN
jgi:hypothetical protein